jgi:hypothetical protein
MSENIHHLSGNLLVGSSHFFVDTTNNRVGITTADPDAGLHVNSNAYVHTDFRVGSGIAMNVTSGRITAGSFDGDGSLLSGVNSDSGSWVNGSSSNIHLAVSTDNVGIGVLDAGYKLDIQFTGDNGLRVKNTATGTSDHSSIYIDSGSGNSYLKFLHSGTNKFTIQGTTSGDMAFRPNGGDHALDIKSNYQTEISSTRTGLTALTNNEATLMISCTDTNAADDGDIGGGVVFRQRWTNSSSSLVPTGGIYGYKDRNSGSYGGGLIFSYCPNNGSPDNLVEAMRITKEGSLRLTGDANHPIKKTAATASTATYNYILNCERPGTTSGGAVHFINGSTRNDDGGTSTYTMRNDSGNTRVGNSSYSTIIAGTKTEFGESAKRNLFFHPPEWGYNTTSTSDTTLWSFTYNFPYDGYVILNTNGHWRNTSYGTWFYGKLGIDNADPADTSSFYDSYTGGAHQSHGGDFHEYEENANYWGDFNWGGTLKVSAGNRAIGLRVRISGGHLYINGTAINMFYIPTKIF